MSRETLQWIAAVSLPLLVVLLLVWVAVESWLERRLAAEDSAFKRAHGLPVVGAAGTVLPAQVERIELDAAEVKR